VVAAVDLLPLVPGAQRWRSRAVLRLAIAAIVLLSLVPGRWRSRAVPRLLIARRCAPAAGAGAMAKPSRVETGAMPKASRGTRARAQRSRPAPGGRRRRALAAGARAMAKPSRVETGAMLKASLDIEGAAEPSRAC